MLRGPCPHSLSWYCRIKSGRVGKVWGRKYPSVSPLHCPDHYSLTHTWPSGGWGLLFVITPSDDGQFSRCMVTCLLTSQYSHPRLSLNDLMSDQYLKMSQQRELLWTEIIGWKILRWFIFSSPWLWPACMAIYFISVWILHPRHYNIYLSGVRIMVCGHIVTWKGERYSGKWCNGGGYHY